MFGRIRSFGMAAMLAALVVPGCESPTPPPEPPPPEAPQASVLSPLSGAKVNWTKPPETPVTLIGRATHRGRKLPADSTEWRANSAFLGRGDTITVSVPVGEVLAVYTARADGFTAADSVRFVNPADSLVVHIATPEDGRVYKWDEPVNCAVLVTIIPPRPYEKRTSYKLNGQPVSCNGDRQFVSGAPPAPIVFAAGDYTFEACGELVGRNVEVCATAKFTVKERPDQILFTGVGFAGSRDFYIFDVDDPRTLTPLTRDGQPKYWLALLPDGTKLVYQIRNGSCASNLVIANRDGSNARELTNYDPSGRCTTAEAPSFSPDGRTIAFNGNDWGGSGGSTPFLINADGSNLRRVPVRAGKASYTFFHPNGREIITGYPEFLSENPEVNRHVKVRKNIETWEELRIFVDATVQSGAALNPWPYDISPDGEWVTAMTPFTAQRIVLIRANGSGEYRWLTPVGSNSDWGFFCGSASGEEYVYYKVKSQPNVLRRIKPDGTGEEVAADFSARFQEVETPRCWRPPK